MELPNDVIGANNPLEFIAAVLRERDEVDRYSQHLAKLYRLGVAAQYWSLSPTSARITGEEVGLSGARVTELARSVPPNSAAVFQEWGRLLRVLTDLSTETVIEDKLFDLKDRLLPEEGYRALFRAYLIYRGALSGQEMTDAQRQEMTDESEIGYGYLIIWRGRYGRAEGD